MALPGDKFTRVIHVQRARPAKYEFDALLGIDGYCTLWNERIDSDGSELLSQQFPFIGFYHKDVGPDGFRAALQRDYNWIGYGENIYGTYIADKVWLSYQTFNLVGPIAVGDLNKSYTTPIFHGYGDLTYGNDCPWDQYPIQLTTAELRAFKEPWDFTKYRHPDGLWITVVTPLKSKSNLLYGRIILIAGNPCPYNNMVDGQHSTLFKPLLYIYTPFAGDGKTAAPTMIYKPFDFSLLYPGCESLDWKLCGPSNRFLSHAVRTYGMGEPVDPGPKTDF